MGRAYAIAVRSLAPKSKFLLKRGWKIDDENIKSLVKLVLLDLNQCYDKIPSEQARNTNTKLNLSKSTSNQMIAKCCG